MMFRTLSISDYGFFFSNAGASHAFRLNPNKTAEWFKRNVDLREILTRRRVKFTQWRESCSHKK